MNRRVIKQFQSQGCSQSRRFLNVRVDTSFDRVKAGVDNLIDFPHLQFEHLCCFFCNTLEDCPYISCCGDFSEVYIKLSCFSLQGFGKKEKIFFSLIPNQNGERKLETLGWRVVAKYLRKPKEFRTQSSLQVENKTSKTIN